MKTLCHPKDRMIKYNKFIIHDWGGNLMDFGSFKTLVDAEIYLQQRLGDNYETDRQEYEIIEQ